MRNVGPHAPVITPAGSRVPTRTGRKLALVITRPDKLPTALLAADALAARFPGGCQLLLEQTRWWDAVRWAPAWRARFAAVHEFPRIATCRGLRELPRLVAQMRRRQENLSDLGIAAHDLIVAFAGITRLANAVISACPSAGKLLCVTERKLVELREAADRRKFRWTTPGWLQNRLVEPLVGLHRTRILKRRDGRGGDGARLVRFVRSPDELFDACLALKNSTGAPDVSMPAAGHSSIFFGRFPNLRELTTPAPSRNGRHAAPRSIVFFGTPFLLVRNLPVAVYTAQLARCLDAICRWYPDHVKIYRPHPAETTESTLLDLPSCGFHCVSDGLAAELYLLENLAEINAVFSVGSTVSRTAFHLGLNAYALWRLFPYQPAQRVFFAELMGPSSPICPNPLDPSRNREPRISTQPIRHSPRHCAALPTVF